jgi:NAD(P)-dependent dehydrogenase (short-subunit alcohol dehydrogenase family)
VSVAATLRHTWERSIFDFLVNNAGFAQAAPSADTTEEQFDALYRVLLKGPYFLTQTLLPLLADGGAIVDTAGATALPGGLERGCSAYWTMKGGVIVLSRHLAKELSDTEDIGG